MLLSQQGECLGEGPYILFNIRPSLYDLVMIPDCKPDDASKSQSSASFQSLLIFQHAGPQQTSPLHKLLNLKGFQKHLQGLRAQLVAES